MTQADPTQDSIQPVSTQPSPTPRAKRPGAPMGLLVWLSLIPVAVIVGLWLYSGWTGFAKEFRRGDHGTTVKADLGILTVVRWTRTGPANPMAGESTKVLWNVAGLSDEQHDANDGNSTKKILSIPFWMLLVVVAILPIITVARAQKRANREFEMAAIQPGT